MKIAPYKSIVVGNISAWQPLLEKIEHAIQQRDIPEHLNLLNFWSARGGGKTVFLELVANKLSLTSALETWGPWDVEKKPYRLLCEDINRITNDSQDKKKVQVILLDNIDYLQDQRRLIDFEQDAVQKAFRTNRIIFVTSSQAQIFKWGDSTIRKGSKNFIIPPLNQKDVEALSKKWKLDKPEDLYHLSLGQTQVLDWIRENPSFTSQEVEERVYMQFLDGLNDDGKKLALLGSVCVGFDLDVIKTIRPPSGLTAMEAKTEIELNNLLGDLIHAGLVRYDSESGYHYYRFVDGAIRRLLGRYFMTVAPDEVKEVHRQASEFFKREAQSTHIAHRLFVDAIYHMVCKGDSPQDCCTWAKEQLSEHNTLNPQILPGWETGWNDPSIVNEMKEKLGTQVFDEITLLIKKAITR